MTDQPKHPNIPAGAVPVEGAIFVDRASYQMGTADDGERMFVVHASGLTLAFSLAGIVTFAESLNRALESEAFIKDLVKQTLVDARSMKVTHASSEADIAREVHDSAPCICHSPDICPDRDDERECDGVDSPAGRHLPQVESETTAVPCVYCGRLV